MGLRALPLSPSQNGVLPPTQSFSQSRSSSRAAVITCAKKDDDKKVEEGAKTTTRKQYSLFESPTEALDFDAELRDQMSRDSHAQHVYGALRRKIGGTYKDFFKSYVEEATIHRAENVDVLPLPISRRSAILISVLPFSLVALPQTLLARERRNRKVIPVEDYLTNPDGLKYYDLVEGKGPVAEKGSTVQVHFDCLYRGITAVSSRESKLLAGNRIISQPYVFQVGAVPGKERKREFVDNPNGLFSAQAAPKPPKAMYTITEGMRVGGKRIVIVPPEAGYGPKGMNEIPPGAEFELNIELLEVIPPEGK